MWSQLQVWISGPSKAEGRLQIQLTASKSAMMGFRIGTIEVAKWHVCIKRLRGARTLMNWLHSCAASAFKTLVRCARSVEERRTRVVWWRSSHRLGGWTFVCLCWTSEDLRRLLLTVVVGEQLSDVSTRANAKAPCAGGSEHAATPCCAAATVSSSKELENGCENVAACRPQPSQHWPPDQSWPVWAVQNDRQG